MIELLKCTLWVLRIESIKLNELIQKIGEVWNKREELREKIIFNANALLQRNRLSANLIKEFLYRGTFK